MQAAFRPALPRESAARDGDPRWPVRLAGRRQLPGRQLAGRSRRGVAKPHITHYLSHEMWQADKDAIDAMPGRIDSATERDRLHAARCR